MCGKGIRCVAKYVYDKGLTDQQQISIETLAGIKYLDLTVEDGKVVLVRVDMGEPELIAQDIWDAIRQKIRELDNPMDDSRALCVADEPLPRIELMEDDHGN